MKRPVASWGRGVKPELGLLVDQGEERIDAVGRQVRASRAAGKTADAIIRETKPAIVAANPGWEHPDLLDWEINYFAAQPA